MKIDPAHFIDASFGFAVVDNDLNIKAINKTLAKILQWTDDYLYGKKITSFIPQLKKISFDQDHEFINLTTQRGESLSIDVIRTCHSFLVICQNYTNYQQVMEQIEVTNKSRLITDKMLDLLYDGCYITDGKGVTLYVNDAFLELSGLARKEVIGKSVYELLEDDIIPKSCTVKVLETQRPSSMIINYHRGRSCLITGAPVFIDGKIERVILTSRDMTELKALKNKLTNATSLTHSLKNQLREIEAQQNPSYAIETRSRSMTAVYEKAVKIASLDTPVLLLGETGVGKDFLVRFIHSIPEGAKDRCFIKLNCGAIPEHLLESELFGYESGAFTSASKHGKAGLIELATNGTLFLDEIGDMPLSLQVKMLDVIQDRRFYRVGGTKIIETNARIIAATNKNLEELISQGQFRQDLFFRLNVIKIVIPPLRGRKDDIIPLAMAFLDEFNGKYRRSRYYSKKVLDFFLTYSWPGNIREMKNMIERLVIMSDRDCIEVDFIEEQIMKSSEYSDSLERRMLEELTTQKRSDVQIGRLNVQPTGSLKQMVGTVERAIIVQTLQEAGSLRDAAKKLDIDLSTLVRKKQKYSL